MKDETINCKDCKNDFVYSVEDQEFMQGLLSEGKLKDLNGSVATSFTAPVRCHECRAKRKTFFSKK